MNLVSMKPRWQNPSLLPAPHAYTCLPTALSDFVFLKLIYPVYTLGYCSKGWHGQYDSELLCLI